MPNGGPECCGECWFNRANGGKSGAQNHNREIPSYCEIRQLEIQNPFYTYCANHAYLRPARDPIPIGPVTVHKAELVEVEPGRREYRHWREPWRQSSDTETVRRHLLSLLEDLAAGTDDSYVFARHVVPVVLAQLVEFREQRAVPILERAIERMAASGGAPPALNRAIEQLRA